MAHQIKLSVRECPSCQQRISSHATHCNHCNTPLSPPENAISIASPSQHKRGTIIAVCGVSCLALAIGVGLAWPRGKKVPVAPIPPTTNPPVVSFGINQEIAANVQKQSSNRTKRRRRRLGATATGTATTDPGTQRRARGSDILTANDSRAASIYISFVYQFEAKRLTYEDSNARQYQQLLRERLLERERATTNPNAFNPNRVSDEPLHLNLSLYSQDISQIKSQPLPSSCEPFKDRYIALIEAGHDYYAYCAQIPTWKGKSAAQLRRDNANYESTANQYRQRIVQTASEADRELQALIQRYNLPPRPSIRAF